MATDNPRDPHGPEEARLSRAWDDFIAGTGDLSARDAGDDLAAFDLFHRHDDAPALDPGLSARIWRDAVSLAGIANTAPLPAVAATGHNGHRAYEPATVAAAAPVQTSGRRASISRQNVAGWLSGCIRIVAIGAVAGMVAGAVSGGIVGRIVMRLVALMSEPWQQGMATENGNAVGDITLTGSLELLVFTAFLGIAGGMVFVAVRPWLPGTGVIRGAVFGGLLLLSSGWLVMDPDNPDYRRFGDPSVNILLFSLIYIVFGMVAGATTDRLDRLVPAAWPARSRRAHVVLGSAVLVIVATPALLVGAAMMASLWGALAGVIILGTRALAPRWAGRFERPADLLLRPRVAVAAYAAVAIPILIGATHTLRAIGEILGSG